MCDICAHAIEKLSKLVNRVVTHIQYIDYQADKLNIISPISLPLEKKQLLVKCNLVRILLGESPKIRNSALSPEN